MFCARSRQMNKRIREQKQVAKKLASFTTSLTLPTLLQATIQFVVDFKNFSWKRLCCVLYENSTKVLNWTVFIYVFKNSRDWLIRFVLIRVFLVSVLLIPQVWCKCQWDCCCNSFFHVLATASKSSNDSNIFYWFFLFCDVFIFWLRPWVFFLV